MTKKVTEVTDELGPGALLSAERVRRGLAVGDIAAQLRLDTRVVQLLEADDFENLPAPIFVKGYLRSYGILMQLDVDMLWAAYAGKASTTAAPSLLVASKDKEREPKALLWPIIGVLVVAGLILLAWMYSRPTSAPVDTNDIVPPEMVMPISQNEADTSDDQSLAYRLSPQDEAELAAAENELSEAEAEVVEQEATPADEPAPEPVADNAPQAVAPAEENLQPIEQDSGLVTISITATSEAWVSIKDADENRIIRDLMQNGENVQAAGVAPFVVNLGNATHVTIMVQGQEFDHTRYQRANGTARFVIAAE